MKSKLSRFRDSHRHILFLCIYLLVTFFIVLRILIVISDYLYSMLPEKLSQPPGTSRDSRIAPRENSASVKGFQFPTLCMRSSMFTSDHGNSSRSHNCGSFHSGMGNTYGSPISSGGSLLFHYIFYHILKSTLGNRPCIPELHPNWSRG
ncbi:hypothetical protein ES703_60032 [subsurface metagenome]